jgi:hypothetical protein
MTSRNAALAILLAYAWGAVFAAAPLPSGWRLEGDALVWTSDTPLRMGGARYEIRTRGRLLGYAMQRGDTLRLRVPLAHRSMSFRSGAVAAASMASRPNGTFGNSRSRLTWNLASPRGLSIPPCAVPTRRGA